MVCYVLDALPRDQVDRAVVVVGHHAERVTKKLTEDGAGLQLEFVEQRIQRGTGDAVAVGLTGLPDDDLDTEDHDVLVLLGDPPLLRRQTNAGLAEAHRSNGAPPPTLTANPPPPTAHRRPARVR